jgi:hypothetical protein
VRGGDHELFPVDGRSKLGLCGPANSQVHASQHPMRGELSAKRGLRGGESWRTRTDVASLRRGGWLLREVVSPAGAGRRRARSGGGMGWRHRAAHDERVGGAHGGVGGHLGEVCNAGEGGDCVIGRYLFHALELPVVRALAVVCQHRPCRVRASAPRSHAVQRMMGGVDVSSPAAERAHKGEMGGRFLAMDLPTQRSAGTRHAPPVVDAAILRRRPPARVAGPSVGVRLGAEGLPAHLGLVALPRVLSWRRPMIRVVPTKRPPRWACRSAAAARDCVLH